MSELYLMKTTMKRWGCEIWIAENDLYIGKIIIINPGDFTSLHKHEKKDETLYVLNGSLIIEWDTLSERYAAGVSIHIKPDVAHRLRAGEAGLTLISISTPHPDDSIRIEL